MTADLERVLAYASIHNFRDYGGYVARNGNLRTARLYRSAQHRDGSPDDLQSVADLGLRAVIDLRGEGERIASPCRRADSFAARVLFVPGDTAGLAPHVAAARDVRDPNQARDAMVAGYADMPFRPNLQAVLRLYFEALAVEEGPTLIHCAAGKDRTGFAVALLHDLLGVHRDDILADYMLTNQAGRLKERFAGTAAGIRRNFGQDLTDEAITVLMSVQPAYLEAAFAAVAERHGSTEAYLAAELGVTPERREQIAQQLLA